MKNVRGLHLGDQGDHKSIKKRSWNSGSVLETLFADFGRILVSFWEAKTAPKRPKSQAQANLIRSPKSFQSNQK